MDFPERIMLLEEFTIHRKSIRPVTDDVGFDPVVFELDPM
jgi:hypothetical protein